MSKKTRRASQEEILLFENSINTRRKQDAGSPPQDASPALCDFVWLDDAVLSALSHEAVVRSAQQYRDIIMGMMDDREFLISSFRSVLERNSILVTDAFGRRSERLEVLLGYRPPSPARAGTGEGGGQEDGPESPVKSSDSTGENDESGREGTDAGQRDPGGKGKSGKDDGKEKKREEKKGGRGWKPVRSKGCLDKQCGGLPEIARVIEMTEQELEDFFGKGNFRRMESNDREIVEYAFIPMTVYVRKTILCAYEASDKTADSVKKEMAVARNPVVRLRSHSRVTSSVWAHVLSQRYLLRLPWERASSDMARDGLSLPPQMMEENARFFYGILCAVIQRMWYWLLITGHIQIDETPVLMYDQVEKALNRCYFWVFTVSELYETDKPVTLFVYAAGKDTGVLRRHLVEDHQYAGYATTDGHDPYHIIEKETGGAIRNTGCLNHFRTRLARVLKAVPGLKNMTREQLEQIPAFNALTAMQLVFKKEKETKGMSAGERIQYRREHVFPEFQKVLDSLSGLEADDYGQGTLMYKALIYRDNQMEYLARFMEDGSIPLTNSNSERHIAFLALLRNASRIFGSDEMGRVGAGWESLVQTARAFTDHVDIYFQYLLDEAVPFIMKEDGAKGLRHTAKSSLEDLEKNALGYFGDGRLDRFMPWSPAYRAYEEKILQERRRTAEALARAGESCR